MHAQRNSIPTLQTRVGTCTSMYHRTTVQYDRTGLTGRNSASADRPAAISKFYVTT